MKRKTFEQETKSSILRTLVYNDKSYPFVFFFENNSPPSVALSAIEKLPEKLPDQDFEASLCPLPTQTFCYSNVYPDPLTFFQNKQPSLHSIVRRCRTPELRQCIESKQVQHNQRVNFNMYWDPYNSDLISHEPTEWIAYLLDGYVIVAAAVGNKTEIEQLEIHPQYRGKGFCPVFTSAIFDAFHSLGLNHVSITNAGKLAGHKCYEKAGKQSGFAMKCIQPKLGYCYKMRFDH